MKLAVLPFLAIVIFVCGWILFHLVRIGVARAKAWKEQLRMSEQRREQSERREQKLHDQFVRDHVPKGQPGAGRFTKHSEDDGGKS